jgi:hypothetical protein
MYLCRDVFADSRQKLAVADALPEAVDVADIRTVYNDECTPRLHGFGQVSDDQFEIRSGDSGARFSKAFLD